MHSSREGIKCASWLLHTSSAHLTHFLQHFYSIQHVRKDSCSHCYCSRCCYQRRCQPRRVVHQQMRLVSPHLLSLAAERLISICSLLSSIRPIIKNTANGVTYTGPWLAKGQGASSSVAENASSTFPHYTLSHLILLQISHPALTPLPLPT